MPTFKKNLSTTAHMVSRMSFHGQFHSFPNAQKCSVRPLACRALQHPWYFKHAFGGMYELTTNSQEKVTGNERKYVRHKYMTGFIDLDHGGKIAKISAKDNRTTFPTLILYPHNKESLTFAFSVRPGLVYYYFFF